MVNNLKISTRDIRYDVIRSIAMICVIMIHSVGEFDNAMSNGEINGILVHIESSFLKIIYIGVPLFVMLSGALLLGRSEPIVVFLKRRLRRVLIPFALWSTIVYAILYWQGGGRSPVEFIKVLVIRTLGNDYYGIFWYVYLIIGIYLLVPALRLVAKNLSVCCYTATLLIVLYLIGIFVPNFGVSSYFQSNNLVYLGLFLMGYVIKEKTIVSKWISNWIVPISLITWFGMIVYDYYIGDILIYPVLAIPFFAYLLSRNYLSIFPFSFVKLRGGIKYFSCFTYGIYLTHFMFISLFLKLPIVSKIPLIIEPFIMVISVTIATCIFFYVINKMKLGKWLM